jgi:hypothetical protein
MVDIVERLRILSEFRTVAPATTREAAEEIERLRSQVDNLRSLITAWADASQQVLEDEDDCHWDSLEISREVLLEAENALRKAVGR